MASPARSPMVDCIETNIPARLDRLPWSRWHVMVVVALGITWLLDGLETNLAGSLAGILKRQDTLGFTDAQLGLSSTYYLAGSVAGALVFGYLTDRWGRKKLFTITILLYLSATAATAFSWDFTTFTFFRALTGAGIGGEYAAINSAIDELIPARLRGHVDLTINSTFWGGAALGSGASLLLLNSGILAPTLAWRLSFIIGAAIGIVVLALRRHVPESPRWLMIHREKSEGEAVINEIERKAAGERVRELPPANETIKLAVRKTTPIREIWNAMVKEHPRRSLLGFALMVS